MTLLQVHWQVATGTVLPVAVMVNRDRIPGRGRPNITNATGTTLLHVVLVVVITFNGLQLTVLHCHWKTWSLLLLP